MVNTHLPLARARILEPDLHNALPQPDLGSELLQHLPARVALNLTNKKRVLRVLTNEKREYYYLIFLVEVIKLLGEYRGPQPLVLGLAILVPLNKVLVVV